MTGADLVATYVSNDLAVVVENERGKAKVGGVFRLEGDAWKLVHRHADPITTPRPAEVCRRAVGEVSGCF